MPELTKIQDMFMKLDEKLQKAIIELMEYGYNVRAKVPDNTSLFDDNIQKMIESGFATSRKTLDSLESENPIEVVSEAKESDRSYLTPEELENFNEFEAIAKESTKRVEVKKEKKTKIIRSGRPGFDKEYNQMIRLLEELQMVKQFSSMEMQQKVKDLVKLVNDSVVDKKVKYKDWTWKKIIDWAEELGYPERKKDKVKGVTPKAQFLVVLLQKNGLL